MENITIMLTLKNDIKYDVYSLNTHIKMCILLAKKKILKEEICHVNNNYSRLTY